MATIMGGLNNVFGSVGDVLGAPFRLLGGDISGSVGQVVRAPFRLVGGVLQTAVGAVTAPFRLLGNIFGVGRSDAALSGAQAGMRQHVQRGAGSW